MEPGFNELIEELKDMVYEGEDKYIVEARLDQLQLRYNRDMEVMWDYGYLKGREGADDTEVDCCEW